jgi:hypothetical protein
MESMYGFGLKITFQKNKCILGRPCNYVTTIKHQFLGSNFLVFGIEHSRKAMIPISSTLNVSVVHI